MNTVFTLLDKLKSFKLYLQALRPSPLPQGISEFNDWATDIIRLSGAPDNDSVRFALAAMIMHLESTTASKPKLFFALALRKGAANQVAHAIMMDLKAKQAAQEAERQKLAATQTTTTEVTVNTPETSNVVPIQK